MSDLMDQFWRTPPIARTVALAVFVTSVGVWTQLLPFSWFTFHHSTLWRIPPHLWRLATNFLISDPKLSIIMDPYFVYSYLSQLETANPRFPRKEDVLWYLTFVCSVIIGLDSYFSFSRGYRLQALILALAYTGTQDQRGAKANFFFVTIPAQLVPYAMMLVSLLLIGPQAVMLQLLGLIAAHLYDFLTRLWPEFGGGKNWVPAPAFLSRLVAYRRVEERAYGTAVRGDSASAGRGPLPSTWETRGRGQRLG